MGRSHDYVWCWANPHQQYLLSLKNIYIYKWMVRRDYYRLLLSYSVVKGVGEKIALKTLKNTNKMATSTLGIGLKSLEYEISVKD